MSTILRVEPIHDEYEVLAAEAAEFIEGVLVEACLDRGLAGILDLGHVAPFERHLLMEKFDFVHALTHFSVNSVGLTSGTASSTQLLVSRRAGDGIA